MAAGADPRGMPENRGCLANVDALGAPVARASLYLALMTDYCFDLIKARGPVIVEGSLTGNQTYLQALATLRRKDGVLVSSDTTGTVSGAALLADVNIADEPEAVEPLDLKIDAYRKSWREALPA
jgi:sugar (pentulose or hexulose) kinase